MVAKVSTTEVATFLTCKQRWMYAHHPSYHLEPRTLGMALTRGVIGHEALEIYYKTLLDGKTHEEGTDAVNSYIMSKALHEVRVGDADKATMISGLGLILKEYFVETKGLLDNFNVFGVEHLVSAPLPGVDDIEIVGRVDVILETARGPYKGELTPWDHKFTYNFWSDAAVKMNVQISNYIWIIRAMGRRSRKGVLNMIRYRDNAVESFKQADVPTNSVFRKTFIENHVVAAKQIVELKSKERVGVTDGVTRSTSKFNCEYCPFINLCYLEANGQDSTKMIQASYRPNSYGYDSELDVD